MIRRMKRNRDDSLGVARFVLTERLWSRNWSPISLQVARSAVGVAWRLRKAL